MHLNTSIYGTSPGRTLMIHYGSPKPAKRWIPRTPRPAYIIIGSQICVIAYVAGVPLTCELIEIASRHCSKSKNNSHKTGKGNTRTNHTSVSRRRTDPDTSF